MGTFYEENRVDECDGSQNESQSSIQPAANDKSCMVKFLEDEEEEEHFESTNKVFILSKEVEREVKEFNDIILSENYVKGPKLSKKRFWIKNKGILPILTKFSRKLTCFSSSSAFIERFFSICGVISNNKNSNMTEELFITRSLLKANISIIKELSKEFNDEIYD